MSNLSAVVKIDREKCVNCHRCIAVCPVKMCNDGSKEYVKVNHDLCIGCGNCIDACTHGARYGIDDFDLFLNDIKHEKKMIAIVAPSIASNFEDQYLNINGWLKSLGVEAFFDVSFGAELTVKSYIDYIKKNNPLCVISQPCPTLVSFIETYRPDLIPYLAPADSPMLHTIKMIRKYFPQWEKHKIAVISPCYAKKREFEATGFDVYNLTYRSIDKYLKEKTISLDSFPEIEYDGGQAERGVLFSTPGGLMRTAERELPGISHITRKIEGQPGIFSYLAHLGNAIKKGEAPIYTLIDCLNCENGCNAGPGTLNKHRHIDVIENAVEKRSKKMQEKYAHKNLFKTKKAQKRIVEKQLNKYWEEGLYKREYVDRSQTFYNIIKNPTKEEIEEINIQMHKTKPEDILNCGACGYNSCEQMAVAIYNGLNKPENCKHFMTYEVELSNQKHKEKVAQTINEISEASIDELQLAKTSLESLSIESEELSSCVSESSASIEQMVSNILSITKILGINQKTVDSLQIASKNGKESMNSVSMLIEKITSESKSMMDASSVIQQIAAKTNLLSMNAAIEAAHAGTSGQGFAVVADEVRKLAKDSGEKAKIISTVLSTIKKNIDQVEKVSTESKQRFEEVVTLTQKVGSQEQSINRAVIDQNEGSSQILESLNRMNEITMRVKDMSHEVVDLNSHIIDDISSLEIKDLNSLKASENVLT